MSPHDRYDPSTPRRESVRSSYRYTRRASLDGFIRSKPVEPPVKPPKQEPAKPAPTTGKYLDIKGRKPRKKSDIKPALPRQHKSVVLHRFAVKKTLPAYKAKATREMNKKWAGLIVALLVIFVGTLVTFIQNDGTQDVKAKVTTAPKLGTVRGLLDETHDKESNKTYRVVASMPRYIRIPKIGVDEKVVPLSITGKDLQQPLNIFDVGWYDSLVRPGENGVAVVAGQMSGPTKAGVFSSLGALQPNDKVEIEKGDGKKLKYRVVRIQAFDNDKITLTEVVVPAEAGKPGLNMITFTNRYDVVSQKFEKRLIVYTVQE
ncbi:MAG: Sortase family enzyme [Candidatus Saccharibacteria bacterium]|nr:Sortase family enzyme [Candidatus Saccharibacteria bacterium]